MLFLRINKHAYCSRFLRQYNSHEKNVYKNKITNKRYIAERNIKITLNTIYFRTI